MKLHHLYESDNQMPEFTMSKVKSGDGIRHQILVDGKLVGSIGGFERTEAPVRAGLPDEGQGVYKQYFDVRTTQLVEFKGTGLYQAAIQQVANQYELGLRTMKFQSSPWLQKALRKMPTFREDADNIWIAPAAQRHNP